LACANEAQRPKHNPTPPLHVVDNWLWAVVGVRWSSAGLKSQGTGAAWVICCDPGCLGSTPPIGAVTY
jgi:hypothetical protein